MIPVYNEELSLPTLVERLAKTFETNNITGKMIVVSDGSKDETGKVAFELAKNYNNLRILNHKTRKGKTAALHTGFMKASGDILAMIDADLQYAPEDLPKLLEKIRQGYDVVNGWRKHRHDSILKKIASSVYNVVSRISFGLRVHDFNSGLKMFKREVIEDLNLRKGQHRFILHLAHHKGYRVGEVEIQHFRRRHGKTKFGASRMFWGLFDLISLRLQLAFTERPMALFGLSGIILSFLGFAAGAYVIALRILFSEPFGRHFALLLLSTFLLIAGIQSFLFGFIADMIADLRSEKEKEH
ncbi:MAG: glycosyltransferase family 2 protein [Candidatus Bathyarchaeota archaeon]|nr:glycosyltransferase family 2 protein [Candidatus Bathyarchaeota archaeon]